MKIKSSYNATIVLPPNVPVYPSAEVDYPHWDKYKDNPAIAWYVEQGHLTVSESNEEDEVENEDEDKGGSEPESESDPAVVEDMQLTEQEPEESSEQVNEPNEDEQKESLIAQLAELGVKADKRSSVEKLQEKLEEALAN